MASATMKGGIDRDGNAVRAHLDAAAGSATASVDGAFDLGSKRARRKLPSGCATWTYPN